MATATIEQPKVVSEEEWLAARKAHLAREKQLTRELDALRRERRSLPWVRVEKNYVFDAPSGKKSLAELFGANSQLIVNHFMLGPGWAEGCVGCSFGADCVSGVLVHVTHHDVAYVAVSRAPMAEIEAYKKRMGWDFEWVSSFASDFNFDYGVSFTEEQRENGAVYNWETTKNLAEELPGHSVFYKNALGEVFRTYSTYARGTEQWNSAYGLLDMTPKGRNETVNGNLTDWAKRHDRYEAGAGDSCGCGEKK